MFLCMINVSKDLWSLFDNVTLEFGTIININVINDIIVIFWMLLLLIKSTTGSRKETKRVSGTMDSTKWGGLGTYLATYNLLLD